VILLCVRWYLRCALAYEHVAELWRNAAWRLEQDPRTVKKRTWLAKGYGSFLTAWRTLQGIEAVHMIRKGRVRWVAKEDAIAQATFIAGLFGIAA
jgi:transposase-like protein